MGADSTPPYGRAISYTAEPGGYDSGIPLSTVVYGITLVTLEEEVWEANPWLLTSFYLDDAAFDGSSQRFAQLLNLLMEKGPDRGYFIKLARLLFIVDMPDQEEAEKRDFAAECIELNFVGGSW